MFSTTRKFAQPLIQNTKRRFQTHGTSESGFDRMIADKLNWSRGAFSGGYMFALMGVGSILGFGAGLLMEEQNYKYHFQYVGNSRLFAPIKSQFGS